MHEHKPKDILKSSAPPLLKSQTWYAVGHRDKKTVCEQGIFG
jgi:hypothetical protein